MIFLYYVIIVVFIFSINSTKLNFKLKLPDNIDAGNQLFNKLLSLNQTRVLPKCAEYKFYNGVILQVIESSKTMGTPLIPIVNKLKKALLNDIKIEKEIRKLKSGAILSFIFSMVITWLFIFYCVEMLNLKTDMTTIVLLFIWQIFGLVTFGGAYKILLRKTLSCYESFFSKIYLFDLSHMAGLSVSELIKKVNFQSLNIQKGHKLSVYLERLSLLIDSKQRLGIKIGDDIELLVDELWGSYQHECEALKTKVTIMKFIWLCIFFLSTYLISLYTVLGKMIN
ncbi:hypothetical protein [Bacteriovorax sp. Seq25_V]|uniref:hypothetical protein n=1 Tax=Bacteriovorax sp. Seq25_V TaxID=1201288 RepID=UPI00038A2FB5|nr:hypothetical protein [Bacteriovorax sp. Seq25_V]EQC46598.1 hypothetical protein M900_2409 [Bacteriovorax sp. Seq25_V]